jgi:hypothetical protein
MERRTFIHIRFSAADALLTVLERNYLVMYGNEPTAAQFCCNIAIGRWHASRCALSTPPRRVR